MKKVLTTTLLIIFANLFAYGQGDRACPKIEIVDPPVAVAPGENMVFVLSPKSELGKADYTFEWKVDQGKIIEGQGTQAITVTSSGLSETTINASLKIGGLLANCKNQFKGTGLVAAAPPSGDWDEFGEIPIFDVFARLDNAFADLSSDEFSKGFFINYGPRKIILDREKWIAYYAGVRKIDLLRITFARGGVEREIRTRLMIISASERGTGYEDFEIINGRDIKFDTNEMSLKLKKLECPTSISVLDPPVAVAPGDDLTFTAKVVGEIDYKNIGYVWTVDGGKIVEGRGTATITVKTVPEITTNATVRITGLPKNCFNSASGSGLVSAQIKEVCPKLKVIDPSVATRPGENMLFTGKIGDHIDSDNIRYVWKIDKGAIVEGQGTNSITVNTSGLYNTVVNALVEIEGLPIDCENRARGSGLVQSGGSPRMFDEFADISDEDVELRLEYYFSEIRDEPKVSGFVVNYGRDSDIAKREKLFKKLMRKYKISSSRITFINGGNESRIRTRLWILPADTDPSFLN